MAPIACSVSVEMARPIAPRAAIAAATYKGDEQQPEQPGGQRDGGPGQQRHRADREQHGA